MNKCMHCKAVQFNIIIRRVSLLFNFNEQTDSSWTLLWAHLWNLVCIAYCLFVTSTIEVFAKNEKLGQCWRHGLFKFYRVSMFLSFFVSFFVSLFLYSDPTQNALSIDFLFRPVTTFLNFNLLAISFYLSLCVHNRKWCTAQHWQRLSANVNCWWYILMFIFTSVIRLALWHISLHFHWQTVLESDLRSPCPTGRDRSDSFNTSSHTQHNHTTVDTMLRIFLIIQCCGFMKTHWLTYPKGVH